MHPLLQTLGNMQGCLEKVGSHENVMSPHVLRNGSSATCMMTKSHFCDVAVPAGTHGTVRLFSLNSAVFTHVWHVLSATHDAILWYRMPLNSGEHVLTLAPTHSCVEWPRF